MQRPSQPEPSSLAIVVIGTGGYAALLNRWLEATLRYVAPDLGRRVYAFAIAPL